MKTILLLLLTLSAAPALAQPGIPASQQLDNYVQAGSTSKATQLLCKAVGSDVVSLAGGTCAASGTNPAVGMLLYINGALLAVGVILLAHSIGSGIVNTAHDGEFLGKKYHTVWMPIKMVAGIFLLTPLPLGVNLAQLLFLAIAIAGSGMAELGYKQVIMQFESPANFIKPHAQKVYEQAISLYKINACAANYNRAQDVIDAGNKEQNPNYSTDTAPEHMTPAVTGDTTIWSANNGRNISCGQVTFTKYNGQFNAGNIMSAQSAALGVMQDKFAADATEKAIDFGNGFRLKIIKDAADEYEKSVTTAMQTAATTGGGDGSTQLTSVQVFKSSAEAEGWLGLGAMHRGIAKVNAEITAMTAPQWHVTLAATDPVNGAFDMGAMGANKAFFDNIDRQISIADARPTVTSTGDGLIDSVMQKINESITLPITAALITAGTDEQGDVDAITNLSSLGGTITGVTSTGIAAFGVASFATGNIIGQATGAQKAVDFAGKFVVPILSALMIAGATLSTYIPLIPLLLFVSGVAGWLFTCVEGFIAAPLFALAFLADTEGEGLPQRSVHGWIFLLTLLLMPALLVFGFFVAGPICNALASLLNHLFLLSIAQPGNSLGGLVTIVATVIIYVVTCASLVTKSYSWCLVAMPSTVMSWLGGAIASAAAGEVAGDDSKAAVKDGTAVIGGGGKGGGAPGGNKGNGGGITSTIPGTTSSPSSVSNAGADAAIKN